MFKAAFGLLIAVACASAAPCTEQKLDVYIGYGAAGCTAGAFTLKDFNWDNYFGAVPVAAEDVWIRPVISASSVGIEFYGQSEDTFRVAGTDVIKVLLSYYIDPPPPILDDFSLSMNANSPVFPATASIEAQVCAGARFSGGCTKNGGTLLGDTIVHTGAGTPRPLYLPFPNPVNKIDVELLIELHANGSVSQIDGATQIASTVPEPGAVFLAGLGLAAIAAVRRKRKS